MSCRIIENCMLLIPNQSFLLVFYHIMMLRLCLQCLNAVTYHIQMKCHDQLLKFRYQNSYFDHKDDIDTVCLT